MGKVFIPAISLGCGCVVKIICNLVLIYNPMFNIYGAAIGSIACHLVAFIINFILINKYIKLDLNKTQFLFKPLLVNILMGLIAWSSYAVLVGIVGATLATVGAIGIAVVSYVVMIVLFKLLEKEDYNMIPGGQIMLKILEKLKIY